MAAEFCSGCGAQFDEPDDRFCPKCGKPRRGTEPTAAAAASDATSEEAPALPKQSPKVGPVILMVVLFGLVPVLLFTIGDCGSSEGEMRVTGGPHGDYTFVTTGCASMQPYGRMGANLHGDGPNDGAVYVTLDHASGHLVELEVPGSCQNADGTDCTVFPVPRAACENYDVTIDYTGTTVNDVRLVEGHVRLQCTLEDGTQVQGAIEFGGC